MWNYIETAKAPMFIMLQQLIAFGLMKTLLKQISFIIFKSPFLKINIFILFFYLKSLKFYLK